ncbi:MAG TPA: DUF4401 domain-containing protein, partial [Myxococcota bacterium]|nr:DUF4401 domain-containing protein [Myxococcota bacterium]
MKLDALLAVLQAEKLLSKEERADIRVEEVPQETPLSVQVMAGVGAWAASCGFLSLLAGVGLLLGVEDATVLLPSGLLLGAGSVLLGRWSERLLARQLSTAWAFAAMAAIGTGAGLKLDGDIRVFTQVGLTALLVLLQRESLVRFLGILFCLTTLVHGTTEGNGRGMGDVGALSGGSLLLLAILWPEALPARWASLRGPLLWATY